jgi:post-segregation antitoxin (ccd killing protein)
MAWLRVRVSAELARKVQWLRRRGVNISQLVRDAIEAEYRRRIADSRAPEGGGEAIAGRRVKPPLR